MNPKPLDARLAERLWKIWTLGKVYRNSPMPFGMTQASMTSMFEPVAAEVRKIVKEAKGGRK